MEIETRERSGGHRNRSSTLSTSCVTTIMSINLGSRCRLNQVCIFQLVKKLHTRIFCVAHVVKELRYQWVLHHFNLALPQESQQQAAAVLQHVSMGFLARGQKLKPLVSEFCIIALGFLTLARRKQKSIRSCIHFQKVQGSSITNW